ncbi:hypothetical protein NP570_25365, partial [Vibrio parahaemolyticus]|nr:hypothetical protein [Vibrio parahaemolyticus]
RVDVDLLYIVELVCLFWLSMLSLKCKMNVCDSFFLLVLNQWPFFWLDGGFGFGFVALFFCNVLGFPGCIGRGGSERP